MKLCDRHLLLETKCPYDVDMRLKAMSPHFLICACYVHGSIHKVGVESQHPSMALQVSPASHRIRSADLVHREFFTFQ